MKIQLGDILIANNGDYYRVVELREGVISLTRVNGYTLFSCHINNIEQMFGIEASTAA